MKLTHMLPFPPRISFIHWLHFKGYNLADDSPSRCGQFLKCNRDGIYMGKETVMKRTKSLIPSSFSSNAGLIIPGSGASLVGFRDRDECLASPGASPSPLRPFISFHEGLFRLSASSFSCLKTGHLQKNKNAEDTRAAMKHKDKYTQ